MFERYNESARKVLLSSRSIAGELGGAAIDPCHILLAILQQAPELFRLWMHAEEELSALREVLEAQGRGSGHGAGGEMHLAAETKTVLALAAEAADNRGDDEIRPWHLLAGVLRANGPAADALREAGADPAEARLVFVASSKGLAEAKTETADLFRLIEQLPASQLGRARVLLQALVETHRAGHPE